MLFELMSSRLHHTRHDKLTGAPVLGNLTGTAHNRLGHPAEAAPYVNEWSADMPAGSAPVNPLLFRLQELEHGTTTRESRTMRVMPASASHKLGHNRTTPGNCEVTTLSVSNNKSPSQHVLQGSEVREGLGNAAVHAVVRDVQRPSGRRSNKQRQSGLLNTPPPNTVISLHGIPQGSVGCNRTLAAAGCPVSVTKSPRADWTTGTRRSGRCCSRCCSAPCLLVAVTPRHCNSR